MTKSNCLPQQKIAQIMISLIFKNWRFLLDAILIIALVVLIFLWNPFGIFGGGLKLGTTTNMVTEIQEIGQLVTAEYYGEVIASIDESRLELIYEDSLNDQANLMYAELKHALHNLYQFQQIPRDERTQAYREQQTLGGEISNWRRVFRQDVSRNNILEKLNYHHDALTDSEYYDKVVEYLWREEFGKDKDVRWNPNERQEEQVLFSLYNKLVLQHAQLQAQPGIFYAYLDEGFAYANAFSSFYHADQTAELPRKEQRKKLAMVGRGWVKAGFDFATLDEHSFYFHEESSELHFFGLEPQILNADINPWFIPEKGIPGFEIIDYNGRVTFKDAKKVKEYCIQKLTLYAHRADLLMNAQKQGEETLKSFFSLLTGKEIRKIHFHNDLLVQAADEIARDEFINYYEAFLLDSLIRQELQFIDSLDQSRLNRSNNVQLIGVKQNLLKSTVSRLRKLPFEDTKQNFNYYASMAFDMGRDELLDAQEQAALEDVRWNNIRQDADKLDTLTLKLWYEDSLTFMMEYNAALSYLIEKSRWMENRIDSILASPDRESWKAGIESTYTILDTLWTNDTLKVSLSRTDSITEPKFLTELLHPFHYDKEAFTSYTRLRTIFGAAISSTGDTTLSANDSLLWVYHDGAHEAMQSFYLTPDQFFNKYLLASAEAGLRADSLVFVFASKAIALPLDTSKIQSSLNHVQVKELLEYYQLIQTKHEDFRHKGAIVRASEWVQAKLSDRKSMEFNFAEVKKYLDN